MNKNLKLFLCSSSLILGVSLSSFSLVSCNTTVPVVENKITDFSAQLESGKTELEIGSVDTIKISDEVPSGVSGTSYTYSTSDDSIMTVSDNGQVTAIKKGSVVITITEKNSGVFKKLNLSVSEGNEEFSLISPAGAPTLALYDTIASKSGAETTSQVTQIPLALKNGSYNYVVFDSISALKLINAKQADYTYEMMLTGGNFHLAGFNTTSQPKVGDKIVTFGEKLVPDLAFKTAYPELFVESNLSNIQYVNSVTDVVPVLKTGLYQGSAINYCFIAQPALFAVMAANNGDTNDQNNITDIQNLNDKISEITNGKFNYIPQGALFVKNDYLNKKPSYVSSFVDDVKKQMKNARGADLNAVVTSMEKVSTVAAEQASKYGFNENVVKALQSNNKNQFGIMDPDKPTTVTDINDFLTTINYK
jgi:hypothetical protein